MPLVLWIILILVMASISSVKLVVSETDQTINRAQGARARIMANMGIAVACNPSIMRDDPLLRHELDDVGYEAKYYSEAAKFNINYILLSNDDELLRNIFMEWGMAFDDATTMIACLKDWIDDDDEVSSGGAEVYDYESMGYRNFPFNRAFYSLSELTYVKGWSKVEELFPEWRSWLTVWSKGKLDVNEAEPRLLGIACNMAEDFTQRIRDEVIGEDGILGTSDDTKKSNIDEVITSLGIPEIDQEKIKNRLTVQDSTTRIESIGWAGDQKRKIVLTIGNRTGVPSLLDRYEEIIPNEHEQE